MCVAVCCSVLQCDAVCANVRYTPNRLQSIAVCCSVLQFVAVCCSVMQCAQMSDTHSIDCNRISRSQISAIHHVFSWYSIAVYWVCIWHLRTLHHTATHCNTLQHTAIDYQLFIMFFSQYNVTFSKYHLYNHSGMSHEKREATISRLLKIIGLFCRISSLV